MTALIDVVKPTQVKFPDMNTMVKQHVFYLFTASLNASNQHLEKFYCIIISFSDTDIHVSDFLTTRKYRIPYIFLSVSAAHLGHLCASTVRRRRERIFLPKQTIQEVLALKMLEVQCNLYARENIYRP